MVKNPCAPPARCLEGYLQGNVAATVDQLNRIVHTECHSTCRGGSSFRYPLYKVFNLIL